MLCPICTNDTKVLESRNTPSRTSVRRRRQCTQCKFRFSTREEVEILDLDVIKRNTSKEPYSRTKLMRGIRLSLEKRKFDEEDFKKLITEIERDLQLQAHDNSIPSKAIGEIIMKHLKTFDSVAYVRFASVYREFQNVQDFSRQIEELENS